MYYELETTAKYYDCDANNELKLSGALRYMQETSFSHLNSLDCSIETMMAEGKAWLLSKVCMDIKRMPKAGEPIRIGTAPTGSKGVRFVREFVIDTIDGERLISANTFWPLVDVDTHKVLRPKTFDRDIQVQEPLLTDPIFNTEVPKNIEGFDSEINIPIRYSYLDVNYHVNNSYYADFVSDALPFEKINSEKPSLFVISFHNEAKLNDQVVVKSKVDGANKNEYIIRGEHDGGVCFQSYLKF